MILDILTLIFGAVLFIYLGYHTVVGLKQMKEQGKLREQKFEEELIKDAEKNAEKNAEKDEEC